MFSLVVRIIGVILFGLIVAYFAWPDIRKWPPVANYQDIFILVLYGVAAVIFTAFPTPFIRLLHLTVQETEMRLRRKELSNREHQFERIRSIRAQQVEAWRSGDVRAYLDLSISSVSKDGLDEPHLHYVTIQLEMVNRFMWDISFVAPLNLEGELRVASQRVNTTMALVEYAQVNLSSLLSPNEPQLEALSKTHRLCLRCEVPLSAKQHIEAIWASQDSNWEINPRWTLTSLEGEVLFYTNFSKIKRADE